MTIRFASHPEHAQWNTHILNNPDGGNIFQGKEFAEQKQLGGWTPVFLFADSVAITVLEKSVPGLGKLWYLPKGPGITTPRELDALLPSLEAFAKQQRVFLVKIEPELLKTPETMADLMKLVLLPTRPIQPNFSTVTLDLSADLDTILTSLPQKGRHAIRRAERDGVTVKQVPASDKNCQLMYRLLSDTAAGSFRIRSYEYYRSFWQRYEKAALGQLFFAYFDGAVVAGAFALVFGKKSTYKDGASIRERTAYGASHLLQWHVISWAKSHGALVHDFCGAPPSHEINNTDHPHYGIGRFKTSFNKEVTDYVGAYDLIIAAPQTALWNKFGERLALKIHATRYHENYY